MITIDEIQEIFNNCNYAFIDEKLINSNTNNYNYENNIKLKELNEFNLSKMNQTSNIIPKELLKDYKLEIKSDNKFSKGFYYAICYVLESITTKNISVNIIGTSLALYVFLFEMFYLIIYFHLFLYNMLIIQ